MHQFGLSDWLDYDFGVLIRLRVEWTVDAAAAGSVALVLEVIVALIWFNAD